MTSKHLVRLVAAGALFASLGVGTAHAQYSDMRVFLTFSGPVSVPGVTLPAGTYQFRRVDVGRPEVIHVLSGNGELQYSMFFALPVRRNDIPSKPEVTFLETATGQPHAVRTLWYEGDTTGYEFMYPKEQARRLMEALPAEQALLTEEALPAEPKIAEVAKLEPAEAAPIVETQPLIPSNEPAAVGTTGEAEEPAALPKTASAMPNVAFTGLLFLVGAAFAGAVRMRRS